jgi:hypothetical protein
MRSEICQMAVRDVNGLVVLTNMLRTDHDKCKVRLRYGYQVMLRVFLKFLHRISFFIGYHFFTIPFQNDQLPVEIRIAFKVSIW